MIPNSQAKKEKINKTDIMHCVSKVNIRKAKNTILRVGENICKLHIWYGTSEYSEYIKYLTSQPLKNK